MRLRSAIRALPLSLPQRLPRRLLTVAAAGALGVLVACGGGGNSVTLLDAFQVIGQTNYSNDVANATSDNKAGSPTAATLSGPFGGVAVNSTGDTLFVADTANYRILGYHPIPTSNGGSATFVLGQADLNSRVSTNPPTQATLAQPSSARISSDGSKLVVADTGNNRVLIWNTLPTATGTAPNVVVGQANFTTSDFSGTPTASNLRAPTDAIIIGSKLLVADKGNNRVLVWNTVPTTNGAPADYVLGQTSLTSLYSPVTTNYTSSGLYSPSSLWSDGTQLLIADTGNHRVLYWSVFPTSTATPADFVIGQTDFNRNSSGTASTLLKSPSGVTSDGASFYVADTGNNRVLKFGSMPIASGQAATFVYGQGETKFTASAANDADQNGTSDDNPSSDTLSGPTGVYISADTAGKTLYVTDRQNHRVLLFTP